MKKLTLYLLTVIAVITFVISPIATVVAYELIFDKRYETEAWREFSVADFEGLEVERSDFESAGTSLAGYKYKKNTQEIKGVLVIAHGMGGGGHNSFMPFIDYFTSNGYYVFTYDAQGNDNSEGTLEGLPTGVISLDNALDHVQCIEEYQGLSIMLFGHSWGGYSVGNALNMHPEVKAAVIVAGFNESEDMLRYQGEKYAGDRLGILLPYLNLYERIKFGAHYSNTSAIQGITSTDASVMIVHSKDDETVPTRFGYDKFYDAFSDNERVEFILYENRGHTYLMYSEDALAYYEQLSKDYLDHLEATGKKDSDEVKNEFMNMHIDKNKCYELNYDLMESILDMFNNCN